ncbi:MULTISPECIES: L-aspartate oxidase [Brevibacterium]|uniref:L-aspartate oxidase n=1 Tax=Brevibacterium antiquum CNRZ 918 TaxID=1255637 RepID=A0A2H1KSD8_9MICO|nr:MULTISPECIES: L-aspartate oxidase [Brevibacterium]SMY02676.1 L-aspartate oxidase [Brevibacterium antiquum CNRZ 918]HCG54913.1 L-aspartate oxidase [Brevibacterium sp.]
MSRVLIIGSGIAGLTTALRLAGRHEVTVVTKGRLGESNTALAQGGIAGVISTDDTVESHIADSVGAGAGLSDATAVRVLCSEGPERILELAAAGVAFDRDENGDWARGLEGAHSIPRILHAGGDATGKAIVDALSKALRAAVATGTVRLLEHTMLLDLVTSPTEPDAGCGLSSEVTDAVSRREVTGVHVLRHGAHEHLSADAVVLATGGAGQLYAHTTNPAAATGDGLAAAIRAGAAVSDMEFYQFHPTSLAGSGFLISEAVRGAGAPLLDAHGHRFMPEVDRRGELAPRDVVALAIHRRMAAQAGRPCYVDARSVPEVMTRFPSIARGLAAHGFDLATDLIPVTPAAHYFMGGIRTDLDGRTSIARLFAVGEVACTGVHGANRLASNSLLEGAVFGTRAAAAIDVGPGFETGLTSAQLSEASLTREARLGTDSCAASTVSREDLQALAWAHLGVERNDHGLRALLDHLGEGERATPRTLGEYAPQQLVERVETANLVLIARSIASHALARRESRGAHTRSDFPAPSPILFGSTTALLQEAVSC